MRAYEVNQMYHTAHMCMRSKRPILFTGTQAHTDAIDCNRQKFCSLWCRFLLVSIDFMLGNRHLPTIVCHSRKELRIKHSIWNERERGRKTSCIPFRIGILERTLHFWLIFFSFTWKEKCWKLLFYPKNPRCSVLTANIFFNSFFGNFHFICSG